MTLSSRWQNVIGMVIALPCAYFWLALFLAATFKVQLPGNMTEILLPMFSCFLLSVVVAARWKRWVLVVVIASVAAYLLLAFGIH